MYIFYRIIGIIICGLSTLITYQLDQKAIKKGHYHQGLYGGKTTIWSLPFYFSFIFLLIFLCSILGWLN